MPEVHTQTEPELSVPVIRGKSKKDVYRWRQMDLCIKDHETRLFEKLSAALPRHCRREMLQDYQPNISGLMSYVAKVVQTLTKSKTQTSQSKANKENGEGEEMEEDLEVLSSKQEYKCDHCALVCTTPWNLVFHMRMHENVDNATSADDYSSDAATVLKNPSSPSCPETNPSKYRCKECGATFRQSLTLKEHAYVHTGERPHKCSHCGATFRVARSYRKHLLTHREDRPFQCPTCDMSFKQREILRRHLRVHTDDRPYKCTICPSAFKCSTMLKNHIKSKHSEPTTNCRPCPQCGQMFRGASILNRHLKEKHEDVKPFVCGTCFKAFRSMTSLRKHNLIHAGERIFPCHICSETFGTHQALKFHLMRHDGLKPHRCEECGAQFRSTEKMHQHARVHQGDCPYHCSFCNARFRHRPALNKHKLTIHQPQLAPDGQVQLQEIQVEIQEAPIDSIA